MTTNGGTGISRADGTALSRWDDRVGTLFDLLADYLITQNRSAVAHTDTTRLGLPHILIIILLAVLDAATCLLCGGQQGASGRWGGRAMKGQKVWIERGLDRGKYYSFNECCSR